VGVTDATYFDWAQRGHFVTIDGTKITDARNYFPRDYWLNHTSPPWVGRRLVS
jgi:hypothetical protein